MCQLKPEVIILEFYYSLNSIQIQTVGGDCIGTDWFLTCKHKLDYSIYFYIWSIVYSNSFQNDLKFCKNWKISIKLEALLVILEFAVSKPCAKCKK